MQRLYRMTGDLYRRISGADGQCAHATGGAAVDVDYPARISPASQARIRSLEGMIIPGSEADVDAAIAASTTIEAATAAHTHSRTHSHSHSHAHAHAGRPAPAKAVVEVPRTALVRQITPGIARNPDVTEARSHHPMAATVRVPSRGRGLIWRPDISLAWHVVPVSVCIQGVPRRIWIVGVDEVLGCAGLIRCLGVQSLVAVRVPRIPGVRFD